jgi:adenylate cyclase
MGLEIERKFLLKNTDWKSEADEGTLIKQGYLNSHIERTVRVRISNNKGEITIKGKTNNLTRKEFEYQIPLEEAISLIKLCEQPIIEKTRFLIKQGNLKWEIDEFEGDNKGLIVAEIELENESQNFDKPDWIGQEVSQDAKYYNSSLLSNPFKNWTEQ